MKVAQANLRMHNAALPFVSLRQLTSTTTTHKHALIRTSSRLRVVRLRLVERKLVPDFGETVEVGEGLAICQADAVLFVISGVYVCVFMCV